MSSSITPTITTFYSYLNKGYVSNKQNDLNHKQLTDNVFLCSIPLKMCFAFGAKNKAEHKNKGQGLRMSAAGSQ